MVHHGCPWLLSCHLTIGGHTVTTTDEHPFMVPGMGWILARDLHPGDLLRTPDGTTTLDHVEIEHRAENDPVTVYNIHVEAHHNYYVLAGDLPVLVHNAAGHGMSRIAATQAPREASSVLPKSFTVTRADGAEVWVNPNATKHIWEETRHLAPQARRLGEQIRLDDLVEAIDGAVVGNFEEMQVVRDWELIFSRARDEGLADVLKHARHLGGQ